MKKRIMLIILVLLPSLSAGSAVPKHEAYSIRAEVKYTEKDSSYSYNYMLTNPAVNSNLLWSAVIYIPRNPSAKSLSWGNLSNGKDYEQYTSESNKDKVLPVGIDGPPGWMYGLGHDENDKGFASFAGLEEHEIHPASSMAGLVITSYALPGITDALLEPAIDYDELPEEYIDNFELIDRLKKDIGYKTKTVAPTAPPQDINPSAFIDYIISLKHQAYDLGWIDSKGLFQSLDVKLINAKDRIARNNSEAAKNILKAFINEVEAQGCESYNNCPLGKHLKSEAYSLLKYNAQYLIDNLK